MHVVVFGANGNIGQRVVRRLLEAGHTVTAFVHKNTSLPDNPKLFVVSGDVNSSDDVTQAIKGTDAIISALGSWGTKQKNVLTVGMQHIIPAMEQNKIKKIISLTGSGVILPNDKAKWYDRLNPLLLKIVAPKILTDGKTHINLLAASKLDWTVIRSPVMKDSDVSDYKLQTTLPLPWERVSRESIAKALVDLAAGQEYIGQAPFIS